MSFECFFTAVLVVFIAEFFAALIVFKIIKKRNPELEESINKH